MRLLESRSNMMPTSSSSSSSPAQIQNEAVAHASLELLSNASLMKKVMDNNNISSDDFASEEKRNNYSMDNFTPPKSKGRNGKVKKGDSPPVTTPEGTEAPSTSTSGSPSQQQPVAEKSSSVKVASPSHTSVASPSSVIAPNAFTPPSPFGPFLGSNGAATSVSYNHFLSQLALPHLHKIAWMTNASRNLQLGGSLSSAFQTPYVQTNENVPPSPFGQTSPSVQQQSPGEATARGSETTGPSYETLLKENKRLKEEMKQKDEIISKLKTKADGLEKQIGELRQLPTGKISHIPIEDMIRIMQEYGSEISNQTLPKRKQPIQKASIVRQFRRWNPEFFRYFVHVNGEWVPRLGKEGEIKRRQEKRRSMHLNKKKNGGNQRSVSPDTSHSSDISASSSTF